MTDESSICPEWGDEPHYFAFIASVGGRVCTYCGAPEPEGT